MHRKYIGTFVYQDDEGGDDADDEDEDDDWDEDEE